MRGEELVPRHVAHGKLLGQELALWRDDSGHANAWENRCPHRGVRLSIGINDGRELRCRYHGWRYASGSGQCTYIPAHPSQTPANTIRVLTYAVAEAYGYVWVSLTAVAGPPTDDRLAARRVVTLRSVSVDASAAVVAAALDEESAAGESTLHWLQPVDEACTVIHAVVLDSVPNRMLGASAGRVAERLAYLRFHHARLARVRDLAETRFAQRTRD